MSVTAETVGDGVLVRLAVRGDRWAEGIPPLPDAFVVSVSFSCEEAADLHGDALALLGYRVVAVPPGRAGAFEADFLVSRGLASAHPTWWQALLGQADRAYDLAYGPVAAVLGDVLRTHIATHGHG
jgi:hypothetical protein